MKKDYDRRDKSGYWWADFWIDTTSHLGRYEHRYAPYFRHPRTQRERRELFGFEHDGLPVRRRRLRVPTAYDDLPIARNYGRSWKDFTRQRRQWEKP